MVVSPKPSDHTASRACRWAKAFLLPHQQQCDGKDQHYCRSFCGDISDTENGQAWHRVPGSRCKTPKSIWSGTCIAQPRVIIHPCHVTTDPPNTFDLSPFRHHRCPKLTNRKTAVSSDRKNSTHPRLLSLHRPAVLSSRPVSELYLHPQLPAGHWQVLPQLQEVHSGPILVRGWSVEAGGSWF